MPFMLVKKKIFPNVHVLEHKWNHSLQVSGSQATIYPVIMHDENQGDPSSRYTNPESANFTEENNPNTFPDSSVHFARVNFEISLTKGATNTDMLEMIRIGVMPIMTAFLENLDASNDLTSEDIESLLELTHETTHREVRPIWNGTKLTGDATLLGDDVTGLTTNQNIEGIAFDINKYYDALQFYTNGKLLRKITGGGMRWFTIHRRQLKRISFKVRPVNKYQNPYNFFGVMIVVPIEGSLNQLGSTGDSSGIQHINVKATARYNEYNENFNAMR